MASTAFCILFHIMNMWITEKELRRLLQHDSPYVRAIALLRLRYAHPRDQLWEWFSPALRWTQTFAPGMDGAKMCGARSCLLP